MPAMHDDVWDAMESRLCHKRDMLLHTLRFDMAHDECLHLVAPSNHIPILKSAAKVAQLSSAEDWMFVTTPAVIDGEHCPQVMLMMRTHEQQIAPLRPRDPIWQAHSKENFEAGEKVIAWLEKRLAIGRQFGTARYVLNKLRNECDNGHQLRYMFPAVMHLCQQGVNERMDRWIDKFGAFKACKHTPAISLEFRNALKYSAALLTKVALLGDEVPEPPAGFVSIQEYDMPAFKIEGVRVLRI